MRRFYIPALFWMWTTVAGSAADAASPFPRPLEQYPAASGVWETLRLRAVTEPFNLVATGIFVLAIAHTFLSARFLHLAHRWRDEHRARPSVRPADVSFKAEAMHFLGEVEAIFGIWTIPLLLAITWFKGWPVAEEYVSRGVNFTEPLFVVVIMAISATRPILRFAERCIGALAGLGRGTPAAWWLAILTAGPLLGSLITEPAAMTISALLLSSRFYEWRPSEKFKYATLGLLFVDVSIGGTLTHFAAPPVLMVARKWSWDTGFMFTHFGWKVVLAIVLSNALYFAVFRREFRTLRRSPDAAQEPEEWSDRTAAVPFGVTIIHLLFLGWTVFTAHHSALFIGGFLFFLAFVTATAPHQNPISLKPAILVGFFLAGLVIHGGLQAWWIAPVLESLSSLPLTLAATVLTAFNDNAAITFLATLVPGFGESLKYAVVAGAVAGGGLTVIANAPNPAGQSILARFFQDGVAPFSLLLGALGPTVIALVCLLSL